jgi:hypothetical protein
MSTSDTLRGAEPSGVSTELRRLTTDQLDQLSPVFRPFVEASIDIHGITLDYIGTPNVPSDIAPHTVLREQPTINANHRLCTVQHRLRVFWRDGQAEVSLTTRMAAFGAGAPGQDMSVLALNIDTQIHLCETPVPGSASARNEVPSLLHGTIGHKWDLSVRPALRRERLCLGLTRSMLRLLRMAKTPDEPLAASPLADNTPINGGFMELDYESVERRFRAMFMPPRMGAPFPPTESITERMHTERMQTQQPNNALPPEIIHTPTMEFRENGQLVRIATAAEESDEREEEEIV